MVKAKAQALVRRLGPGLITGAADDDPSGIATYSQAGAQFSFGLVWTLLITTPLMIGIQMLSARIGWVTNQGLTSNINRVFPRWATGALVGLLLVANTINIAADISAMAEAMRLLKPGSNAIYVFGIGLFCIVTQVLFSYESTVRFLKWLTLGLFAYVAVLLNMHIPWQRVWNESIHPLDVLNQGISVQNYAAMVVAVLGTTISPYLFFWQAAQEVEDANRRPEAQQLKGHPAYDAEHLYRIKEDTFVGMTFSNLIALCIVIATAVTLHDNGITHIETSAQAAQALRPVAGEFAFAAFALGIIGTGLLAVPVLAGSAAYALSEFQGWRAGLSHDFHEAKGFYLIIILATGLGALLGYHEVDPMRMLVWSAIVNGVIAVPIMVTLMWIGQSEKIMGQHTISGWLKTIGWLATGLMAVAVVGLLITTFA